MIYLGVLGLAGVAFIFSVAALIVLCFALAAENVLLAHEVFWLLRCSHSIKPVYPTFPPHQQARVGGKILGGDIARTANPN